MPRSANVRRRMAKTEPTPKEEAEIDRLLEELGTVTAVIREGKATTEAEYARQTTIFLALRARSVTNQRIATVAGISEEAVIQRLRPHRKAG